MGSTNQQRAEAVRRGIQDCLEGKPCSPPWPTWKAVASLMDLNVAKELNECYTDAWKSKAKEFGKYEGGIAESIARKINES